MGDGRGVGAVLVPKAAARGANATKSRLKHTCTSARALVALPADVVVHGRVELGQGINHAR